MRESKELITAVAAQIPIQPANALFNHMNRLGLPKDNIFIKHIQNLRSKLRLIFYTESPSMEADIYISLTNALG